VAGLGGTRKELNFSPDTKGVCMKTIIGLAAFVVVAVTISCALAAAPATDEAAIKKLVADLGDKDAAVREAAEKRLGEMGSPAWPALLEAAKSADPEIRSRAKAVFEAHVEVTVKDLGPMPANLGGPLISPNGEHVANTIIRNDKAIMVCDGKEGPAWDAIFPPDDPRRQSGVANDGSATYVAVRAGVKYVVRSGQEDKAVAVPGDDFPRLLVSADGKHLAYAIPKNGQEVMIFDGAEVPTYSMARLHEPFLSPDGGTLAYFSTTPGGGQQFWVVGGKPAESSPYTTRGAFSHEGKQFAFAAKKDDKMRVFCGGQTGEAFGDILRILFTPDTGKLAYVGGNWIPGDGVNVSLVLDGKEVRSLKTDGTLASDNARTLVISPDGKHIAYAVAHGEQWNLVIDDKPLPQVYDADNVMTFRAPTPAGGGVIVTLTAPGFSADGRHIFARGYNRSPQKTFMAIDGVARPAHANVWIPRDMENFPKVLRYVVRDGDRLRLVETYWPEDRTWEDAAKGAK
jgi:hypothetical protein